jgi:hypothetical protein
MNSTPIRSRSIYFVLATAGFLAQPALAQPALPADALEQFQHVIGNRVEAVTILGGDYAAAGGIYTFRSGAWRI